LDYRPLTHPPLTTHQKRHVHWIYHRLAKRRELNCAGASISESREDGRRTMAQQSGLIVSVSGIRGIVGQGLTPEAALAFAAALGTATGGGRIVLSRDGRPSGAMLRHAVLAGLLGA